MTVSAFCVNCGTREKTNTVAGPKVNDFITTCPDCEIHFSFHVINKPTKTIAEADESFTKTALTKNQQFGGGNKPFKYKGKSKRKKK